MLVGNGFCTWQVQRQLGTADANQPQADRDDEGCFVRLPRGGRAALLKAQGVGLGLGIVMPNGL